MFPIRNPEKHGRDRILEHFLAILQPHIISEFLPERPKVNQFTTNPAELRTGLDLAR